MKVLITDKLSENGLKIFKQAAALRIDYQPGLGREPEKVKKAIRDADAVAIRSGTNLTADILKEAAELKVIGRAGIGVDNVDINYATSQGIIVMNAPGGNTITTAEHAIAMMGALVRQIPQATASLKDGKWEKAKFIGTELYQKTLGVIGCGNIGRIVVDRAQGLKMHVIVHDPFLTDEMAEKIGVNKVSLDTLYKEADIITIHVPKNDKTAHMIDKAAFGKMKKGVYLVNCARGGIVNEDDLAGAIESGIVAGAALDVFEKEPVDASHPLLKMDRVIATPHLGAATGEAQENVAIAIARQIVQFLTSGTIQNALNFPSVSGEILAVLSPHITLAEKIGHLQGQLAEEAPQEIRLEYAGEITRYPTDALTASALHGVLEPVMEDVTVNLVNAPVIARQRGIRVTEAKSSEPENFSSLITVTLVFKKGRREISGTIFGKNHPRIVRVDNYYLEAVPEGRILVIHNQDRPGVVGHVGTILARNKINISRLQLGLNGKTKEALSFYSIEGKASAAVIRDIGKVAGVIAVNQVSL